MQFHPTAIDIGADPAPLATESLRGEGATDRRPGRTSLPRRHRPRRRTRGARHCRARRLQQHQGWQWRLSRRARVDRRGVPDKIPDRLRKLHGGRDRPRDRRQSPSRPPRITTWAASATDATGRTSLAGLWAAGEVACTGLHGANRLASNSLLEAMVFGARVAADIAASASDETTASCHARASNLITTSCDHAVVEELRDVMAAYVGVVRDGAGLAHALGAIRRLRRQATGAQTQNMLTTALLIASAAFARRESRGAHFRSDFPTLSPELGAALAAHAERGRNNRAGGDSMTNLPALSKLLVADAVRAALAEDLGRAGDITTQATIPADGPREGGHRGARRRRDRRARAGARSLFANRRGDHVRAMRRRRRACRARARSSRAIEGFGARDSFGRARRAEFLGAAVRRRDADRALCCKNRPHQGAGFATRARPRRCCAPLKNTRCDAAAAPITASASTTRYSSRTTTSPSPAA